MTVQVIAVRRERHHGISIELYVDCASSDPDRIYEEVLNVLKAVKKPAFVDSENFEIATNPPFVICGRHTLKGQYKRFVIDDKYSFHESWEAVFNHRIYWGEKAVLISGRLNDGNVYGIVARRPVYIEPGGFDFVYFHVGTPKFPPPRTPSIYDYVKAVP